MPGGFALAALGFALRFHVEQAIREHDVSVTGDFALVSRAPEALSSASGNLARATLTLYPYQLVPNHSWFTSRPDAMSSRGVRRDNRLLALDVRYLLAGYGPDNANIDLVLGLALLAMHDMTEMTGTMFEAAAAANFPPASPLPEALRELAGQPAIVHVRPVPLELEALSQLWSTMNAGLRTAMTYEVGAVLMEKRHRRTVAPAVLEPRIGVSLIKGPAIVQALFAPAQPADAPWTERAVAAPGERLRLEGSGLRGDVTELAIAGRTVALPPAAVTTERIEASLPADLRPGLTTVQVVQRVAKPPRVAFGPPAAGTVPGERSNLVPLAIRPVLATPAVTLSNRTVEDGIVRFTATANFAVPVGARQRAELILTGITPDAAGRTFSTDAVSPLPPPTDPPTDPSVATRTFTIADVRPGQYLVRAVVDGAESALAVGPNGYSGPLLTVPA